MTIVTATEYVMAVANPILPVPPDMAAMQAQAGEAARLLKHLAHETRLLVLCHLWEHELSVGELNRRIDVSQSVLSQHLAVLRTDGVVDTRREAQSIFYRLADPKAQRILALLHELYCPADDRQP